MTTTMGGPAGLDVSGLPDRAVNRLRRQEAAVAISTLEAQVAEATRLEAEARTHLRALQAEAAANPTAAAAARAKLATLQAEADVLGNLLPAPRRVALETLRADLETTARAHAALTRAAEHQQQRVPALNAALARARTDLAVADGIEAQHIERIKTHLSSRISWGVASDKETQDFVALGGDPARVPKVRVG